ncbi:hypothetical protein [Rhodoferax saidenbachensis]|uniref:Uncharacterized protein n=1 Tax=Rhodoferax saidenbachensis TaxID=1484693 RepID=A0A1P8K6A5_9BURK|nr:hypothetical protein [Rhodoferax saidenbachensis]APW41550.1 hypothetical protein RS694_02615 [Rhodoferax saidenbachensis]
MKHWCIAAVLALNLTQGMAGELFPDGKLRPILLGDAIPAAETMGGYPIFAGDGKWTFVRGSDSTSSRGTKLASLQMSQFESGVLFATQIVDVAVSTGDGAFWNGSPCTPTGHLVMRNKGFGREDHCLTIDPVSHAVGPTMVTMLSIKLTNTGSTSRLYNITLLLNPDLLGIRSTGVGDWTPETLKAQPRKQAFMDKLTAWAESLQAASIKAMDYSKPQDVFAQIPSFRTLLPVSAANADQKYSIGFLSGLEDLKWRPNFKAIAYSQLGDYRTTWKSAWNYPSQPEADKKALDNCESGRPAAAPPCKLFTLEEQTAVVAPEAKP